MEENRCNFCGTNIVDVVTSTVFVEDLTYEVCMRCFTLISILDTLKEIKDGRPK